MKRSTWLIILAAVVLIASISAVYFFRKQTPNKTTVRQAISATPTKKPPSPSATPTILPPTASPTVPAESDTKLIKQAIIKKHGYTGEQTNFTVTILSNDGIYAQGTEGTEGLGGGVWTAKKVNGVWEIVTEGNGIPSCSDFIKYPDIPSDLIKMCTDPATGEIVNR